MLKSSLKAMAVAWHSAEAFGIRILGWVGFSPVTARQLIRFGVVGVCAAAVYVGVTALLVERLGQSILVGTVVAFVVGSAVSYAGNALWSFEAQPTPGNAASFAAVVLAGLLVNALIALTGEHLGVGYLVVNFTVLIVVPAFNFVGHRLVTFALRTTKPGAYPPDQVAGCVSHDVHQQEGRQRAPGPRDAGRHLQDRMVHVAPHPRGDEERRLEGPADGRQG
jgi:putative flippase GtrA